MYKESISTNNLTIGYKNTRGGEPTIIQRNLSFSLHAGEMVCMLGPNGCGKSTLLRTLAGLQDDVRCTKDDVRCTKDKIALVLTERLSMENTTVHDVVALGRYPYTSFLDGLSADDERIIVESLEQVGVPPHEMHTFFNAHSDGEKQRILIAKALAQQTPMILMDEPSAFLDFPSKVELMLLLRELAHTQEKAILLSTHDVGIALKMADELWLMQDQNMTIGTPQELLQSGKIDSFLGESKMYV